MMDTESESESEYESERWGPSGIEQQQRWREVLYRTCIRVLPEVKPSQ